MTTNHTYPLLEDLERAVILGQRALTERNRLLVQLADEGHTGVSLYNCINAVRVDEGAQPLTPDAIHAAIRRGRADRKATV